MVVNLLRMNTCLTPVCLLLASALCARQNKVAGKVTNEADGKPLAVLFGNY